MFLGADSGLDHLGVEGVRDERDEQIRLLSGLIKGFVIADIKGDSLGVAESFAKLLRTLEGSAGCIIEGPIVSLPEITNWALIRDSKDIPTVTSTPALLRTSTVGLVTV